VTGAGHPERASRVAAFVAGLREGAGPETSELGFLRPIEASSGGAGDLLAVHDVSYVELVQRTCAELSGNRLAQLPTGDTMVSRASYDCALLAARSAIQAARMAKIDAPAFSAMRPPGHHAEPNRGMGFCVFNNVATAAAWARKNVGSVLIVDFDYHHGNGTQAWVERTVREPGADLGFISTHAYPAYPGTGAFNESQIIESGFVIDIPLPLGTGTEDFIAVWASLLPPLARRVAPKLILISAGFDFLSGDPIAGLPVALRAVDELCCSLQAVSAECAAPLAFVLEGGYSLENMRGSGQVVATSFRRTAARTSLQPNVPADARLRAMVSEVVKSVSS